MRLSYSDISAIVNSVHKICGYNSKVYLFGSRIEDNKKGGDIDLYIEPENMNNESQLKNNLLVELENNIGEQKIDIVLKKDKKRQIEIEAIEKGIELNLNKIRIDKYFKECDKHIQRIDEAFEDIKKIIPINSDSYLNLTKNEVQAIDQYIFRFSKLQDTLGEKIFRLLIEEFMPSNELVTFIDKLNMLEKLGFINSVKEWQNLRKIRNEIAHQYDDEPDEMSQSINNIINQKDIIKNVYIKLKKKYYGK